MVYSPTISKENNHLLFNIAQNISTWLQMTGKSYQQYPADPRKPSSTLVGSTIG